jgi:hypothetical protein
MMGLKRSVIVTLQVEGFHHWPDAPDDVAFLRYPHRHTFHIEACKAVEHNNRDIEIILMKRSIQRYLLSYNGDFGQLSCEDIAERLINEFGLLYCRVLEDGENGACLIV